jgi:putative ABC transport system permease protein
MLAYAVAQRTREIGLRMALGARRSDVVRLVVSQGAALALAGIALGLAGAFAARGRGPVSRSEK